MTNEQNKQLIDLLRIKCAEDNAELDTGPLADLSIPTVGGGHLNVPLILLATDTQEAQ